MENFIQRVANASSRKVVSDVYRRELDSELLKYHVTLDKLESIYQRVYSECIEKGKDMFDDQHMVEVYGRYGALAYIEGLVKERVRLHIVIPARMKKMGYSDENIAETCRDLWKMNDCN